MAFKDFFQKRAAENVKIAIHQDSSVESVVRDGDLEYTHEIGGNGGGPSYQEATGAPVEKDSPLGYEINWFTVIFLNIGQMVGTGVFSTPGSIFRGLHSVGLSLLYWFIGLLVAGSGFTVYLELASYFPSRSGKEVVYLEQAYPRPRYFFPTTFAMLNVLLAFSSSNAMVLSDYLFRIIGREGTEWESKGIAVAGYTVAVFFCIISNKYSLLFSNVIGVVKVLTLIFISITGFVVLGGGVSSIPDPGANFRNSFEGSTGDAHGIVSALVRINFAYEGYQNAFNMINEVKNPIKTIRWAGLVSLLSIAVLYMLVNVAYFSAVPKEEILESKTAAAALFFAAVFGKSSAARGFNFLILVSSFGNLVTNLIGQSRLIREIGRQGVLPYPAFWASTQPFGTPLGPYLLKWTFTIIMIVAPPAGDAFDFAVDLKSYPDAVFMLAMGVGLYVIRWRRKRINAGPSEFRAWDVAVLFWLGIQIILLAMPWVPPKSGRFGGSVSFWYATYCVVGIGILILCGIYYWLWIYALPKHGNYQIRQEILILDNGAQAHKLLKVPNAEVAAWDETHDAVGKLYNNGVNATGVESNSDHSDSKGVTQRVFSDGTKEV